jgi:hypothetical protein
MGDHTPLRQYAHTACVLTGETAIGVDLDLIERLFVPLLFGLPYLYSWARPELVAALTELASAELETWAKRDRLCRRIQRWASARAGRSTGSGTCDTRDMRRSHLFEGRSMSGC